MIRKWVVGHSKELRTSDYTNHHIILHHDQLKKNEPVLYHYFSFRQNKCCTYRKIREGEHKTIKL